MKTINGVLLCLSTLVLAIALVASAQNGTKPPEAAKPVPQLSTESALELRTLQFQLASLRNELSALVQRHQQVSKAAGEKERELLDALRAAQAKAGEGYTLDPFSLKFVAKPEKKAPSTEKE